MQMNEQIWVDIVGYEGHYQISNDGQVKSLKNGKEKILNPSYNDSGYLYVNLWKDGKYKTHKIHRLVAFHYVSGYVEGYVVNHIDEDKSNNVASNLEWVTSKENTNHGTSIERGIATRQSNRGKLIYCVELDITFSTQREAAEYFGCCRQHIGYCLSGVRRINGYHLEYR
jgi:hypothetical protein